LQYGKRNKEVDLHEKNRENLYKLPSTKQRTKKKIHGGLDVNIQNSADVQTYDCLIDIRTKIRDEKDVKTQNFQISKFISNQNEIITTYDNEQIFFYKEGYYQQQAESRIKDQIQIILGPESTKHRVNEIIDHIKRQTYKEREIFDNTPLTLINLKNGIYNLETQELLPHDPKHYFLSQINCDYNKDAWISEKMLNFFSQIVSEKEVKLLTEFIAYCMYRYNPHKTAFMLNGGGNNGKTTFLKIVMALLGKNNYSSIELQDLDDNRFSRIELYSKHANLVDDLPSRALKQTGVFKSITGNGEISAEMKYGGRFNYVPYAKLCFATNNVPRSNDDSDAFFQRWIIINFPNSFVGEKADKTLDEKLTTQEEIEGLLMYCLSILQKVRKEGFTTAETIEEKREKYTRLSDPVGCFLLDFVELEPSYSTPKEDLYEQFQGYCRENNYSMITEKTFSRAIYTIYPKIQEGRLNVPFTNDRKRSWIGIKYIGEMEISFPIK